MAWYVVVGGGVLKGSVGAAKEQCLRPRVGRNHRVMKHRIEAVDAHQLLRLREGQRPEQHSVEKEKDGKICTDAQRQDKYGRNGEAGALAQLARSIINILVEKPGHRLHPSR